MSDIYLLDSWNCCTYEALFLSENYAVCTLRASGKIAVWNFKCIQEKPITLTGHHRTVTAVALSHKPKENFLCSCSTDNIILWDLSQNDGHPERGKVLLSNVEQPSCAAFTYDDSKIIICCDPEIFLYNLMTQERSTITSQTGMINDCKVISSMFMATIDEESYVKVWNLDKFEVVNQKVISPGFPCAIAVHRKSQHLAIATTTGHLYIYAKHFTLIRNFRMWFLLKSALSAADLNIENCDAILADLEDFDSDTILCLHIFTNAAADPQRERLVPDVFYLLIVTSSCMLIVNLNIEKAVYFFNFMEPAVICKEQKSLGLVRLVSIAESEDKSLITVFMVPVFGNSTILLKLSISECCKKKEHNSMTENCKNLSFLSSNTECEAPSYLKIRTYKTTEKAAKSKTKKASSIRDNPLTFHTKIKSSGYGPSSKISMFQPQKSKLPQRSAFTAEQFSTLASFTDCETLFENDKFKLLSKFPVCDPSTLLCSVKLSVNGKHILCAGGEGNVEILRCAKENYRSAKSLSCHNGNILSINWNHGGNLFVSSGIDNSAKLWDLRSPIKYPILTFNPVPKQVEDKFAKSFSMKSSQMPFEDEVTQIQFYYLDQFILLCSKNNLFLYDYFIKNEKTELKRFNNLSRSKLVVKVPLELQRITAIAAINQFFSNLVLCTGTSKSLDVLDMNTAQVMWHAENISSKPSYLISLNEGSVNAVQENSMYNIFLTASLIDGIKLWDLRTQSPIMKYREHSSTTIPCSASFSTCGKYIASGSENKSMYVYDLRSTYSLRKLCDHSDVVISALFHPVKSQVIASTLNGMMYIYGHGQS